MKIITTAFSALALMSALSPVAAFAIEPAWVGVRAGTNGVGGEVGVRILPTLVLRGVAQGYDYGYDQTIDDIAYDGTMKLGSYGLQADFRPPVVPFYLTAGIFANDNQFDLVATPATNVVIGNTTYTPAQVGTLSTKATFDDIAYFVGAGLKLELGPIETALEAGVYYQGDPQVVYTSTGLIASNPAFQADLALETAKIVDELDAARYWPMVTLHGRYKF
ncbi:hypothetical protein [Aquidulcibacter sp.]|jgi:hypothetical protein|uniref:hypothetical protein n=1 Tax=Aquidulcibacter sp. TaxID=2052990 RepID=UPI0037C13AD1